VNYYWTTHQSEWAIDTRFEKQEELRRLYPALLRHAITTLGSPDALRFLGKPTRWDGNVPRWYSGELFSDLKTTRGGHWDQAEGNSLRTTKHTQPWATSFAWNLRSTKWPHSEAIVPKKALQKERWPGGR
jgi:hypothetical protein